VRVSLAGLAFLAVCVGCGSERTTLDRLWHSSGQSVALISGTSEYAAGDVRVSFLVVTDRGRAVSSPTADVWLARSRDAEPSQRTVARLEDVGLPGSEAAAGDVQAIYVAHLSVPKPGRYWILARPRGADVRIGGIEAITVKRRPATPALGAKAISSHTPTLGTEPITRLTTRVPPDRALLRYSIADSLRRHVPFVVTFATPRFCASRTCGPVVDVVDAARKRFARRGIRFIHVEIYRDNIPSKGTNRWVREWRLPTEPWTFVVGRDGRVKAKFEGSISVAELRDAILRSLA
jgi:hypothetical protein